MSEPIIGIDLGTTNSEVAIVKDGQPTVISENNRKIMPSFVGLSDKEELLVGEPAKNQYLLYPEQTIKSIKRKMGSTEKVILGSQTYTPQEISAMILRKLKSIAENHLGQKVGKAVITVPAYFSDAQRQATRDAGEIAGLDVVKIINEPTAAALAYEANHKEAKKILVYDLGGGTFDVSVVNIQNNVVEVLSGHGNNQLGGDDFDEKIVSEITRRFKDKNNVDLRTSTRSNARVVSVSEQAKIHLSDNPFATIQEEYIFERDGNFLHIDTEISRYEYEDMIKTYIDETLHAAHISLKGAGISIKDIDEILLVGGSTRTPLISMRLKEIFNIEPRKEVDPDLCVAMGAAIQAAMIGGQEVSSVLVDITPYAFGTSVVGELRGMPYTYCYVPIIEKNTSIPVSKAEVFYTVVDNQEVVDVKVYQGENEDALENILIGNFKIEGLSKVPSGNEIVMSLDLDVNGILHVSAIEKRTGLKKSIKIDNATSQFENEEMTKARERINKIFEETESLEVHSEKKEDEPDLVIKARELLINAESSFNDIPEEDKEDVLNLTEDIKEAINNKDYSTMEEVFDELSEIMFYLGR